MLRKLLLKLHKRLGEYLRVPAFNYSSLDYSVREKRIFSFYAELPIAIPEAHWITPDRLDHIHNALAHKIADQLLELEAIEFTARVDAYHQVYRGELGVVK